MMGLPLLLLVHSALKSTLVELFTPKRPLKPVRRERKRIKAQNLTLTDANITIRIVRAFNVPVRETALGRNTNQGILTGTSMHEEAETEENALIEVIFTPLELSACRLCNYV